MKQFLLFISLIVIGLLSCNNQKVESKTATIPVVEQTKYFPMPAEKWDYLLNNCTSLDITFYSLGFSMNASSCSQMLPLIESTAPTTLGGEEFGHILFLVQGEKFSIAKIVLSRQHNYLQFEFDEGVYYHNLNQKGIEYFANIKAQVEAQMQQKP